MKLTKAEVRQVYAACELIELGVSPLAQVALVDRYVHFFTGSIGWPLDWNFSPEEKILALCLFVAVYSEGR